MNQLFVGMKKIPVEQGSGYNVAYYILVEEAGQHLSPGAGGHDPLGNPSSFAGRGG